jgi:hypothetical protein
MKPHLIWLAVIALVAQTAQAGHLGLGGFGDLGLGGQRGGFGGFDRFDRAFGNGFGGGLIGGLASLDAERLQTHFENKFDDLQSDYDSGLADVEDFYNSDEYSDVVDGVGRLIDRYGLFLTGVEHSIDRLGDVITLANDDLSYYDDLIAQYQARDDLSQQRIDRIVNRLTSAEDRLNDKIDFLTEKQTTLSDNLGSYQTFSSDLSAYLDQIVAAGGGTTDTGDSTTSLLAEMASSSPLRATLSDDMSSCDLPPSSLEATAAPEPATPCLTLVALGLTAICRTPRRRLRA